MISNVDSYSQNKAKPAKDCIMVIFGAGGDLTSRLLLPTICHLGAEDLLSNNFKILGVAGLDYTDETFKEYLLKDIAQKVNDPKAALLICSKMLCSISVRRKYDEIRRERLVQKNS